jgi:transposase
MSRGGFSTKVHIKAEGLGKPLAFVLTEGERHESPVFEELMKLGAIRRNKKGVGRPRFRPKFLAADRAYGNHRVRGWLRRRKIRPVIPKGGREKKLPRRFEKELYKERNRIERLVCGLKQNRRIATRYEKTAASYLTMLTLGAILLWL